MAEAAKPGEKKPVDRVIRVFVSSTFRDMHKEREELVKRVFPELRKLCEARGVTWGEVDLRWGIPDERKAEGKVLPICLAEIKNCRPYFIGILGERYGWVPRETPEDLVQTEPWLKEHVRDGKSVTELEILHGVLNDPQMATHAFFYFRDPGYAQAAELGQGPDHDEVRELGPAEAAARAKGRKLKLAALKDRIRQAHREGKIAHPARENFTDPTAFGEMVRRDLVQVIDGLFPEGSQPDALAREVADHEAFARSRARVYVERPALFAALDAHAVGDGPPLVVLGESGGGKSALLANWVKRKREQNDAPFVIQHHIGATPANTDWAAMCRRVLDEVSRRFDLKLEIPDEPEALRAAFANGLYRAAAQGRVVLVLDGLNQLEDRDQAPDLVWLPPELPPDVRLVLSTLPGRSLKALAERGWPTLTVDLLSVEERRELIPKYLKQYSKELSPARTERLAVAAQTASPLYLRTLLEELRQWGDNDSLDDRIDHYLAAPTPRELFAKVLKRWEQDFERDRPDLVRDAMVRLWAARRGLSEEELLEMLGRDGQPLPRAHWSPLFLAADASLMSRSGLLGFAHDYLRQAVEMANDRYLSTPEGQRAAHAGLADYFASRPLGPRKVDELPWQLGQAEAWQRLYDLLADILFFDLAWQVNQYEVKASWGQLEANSYSKVKAYRAYSAAPERIANLNLIGDLSQLFADTGHLHEALQLREHLEARAIASNDRTLLSVSLGNQARMRDALGDLNGSLALHRREEQLSRELNLPDGIAASLGNQGIILTELGDLKGAMKLHQQEDKIWRELGSKEGLQKSFGNQAVILKTWGRLDKAMALLKAKEQLCKELGNKDSLSAALANQAVILALRGDLDGALRLHGREEAICRELGNREGLAHSLNNQAVILTRRGQFDDAMRLLGEVERDSRKMENRRGVGTALGNQARVLHVRGDPEGALRLHRDAERIFRNLALKAELQGSLGDQATILCSRGDFDAAMRLCKEQERLCRELHDPRALAGCLGNQAAIHSAHGELDQAVLLLRECEQVFRKLGDRDGVQKSLTNQGNIHLARGNLDEALAHYVQAEYICRDLGNKNDLASSLGNQAVVLAARGDVERAMELHQEEEKIYRELGNMEGLSRTLDNQALIHADRRDFNTAMRLHKEVEQICRRFGYKENLQRNIGNQANVLAMTGDLDTAEALYAEQARICRELNNADGLARASFNLALLHLQKDDLLAAREAAEQAYRIAEQCGFRALAAQIAPLLQHIRQRL
jgi:tetratricopeptide (TPR) repeat protein